MGRPRALLHLRGGLRRLRLVAAGRSCGALCREPCGGRKPCRHALVRSASDGPTRAGVLPVGLIAPPRRRLAPRRPGGARACTAASAQAVSRPTESLRAASSGSAAPTCARTAARDPVYQPRSPGRWRPSWREHDRRDRHRHGKSDSLSRRY